MVCSHDKAVLLIGIVAQGGHSPGKPGKVREKSGKMKKSRKSQGN